MSHLLTRIIRFFLLLAICITPLIYSPANSELFEIPKAYFFYLTTLIVFFLHGLNRLSNHRPFFSHHPLNLALLIFLASQLLSFIFSIDRHTSFFGYYSRINGGLLSLSVFCFLFLIIQQYLDKQLASQIINRSLIVGFVVSLFGIIEHFDITSIPVIKQILQPTLPDIIYSLIDKYSWKTDIQARVFSTLGQPNWLAAYLCILLPFSLDRLFKSKTLLLNTIYSLLNTSFWLCLLYTKSKSGIIAAIISLGIYFAVKVFLDTKKFAPFLNLKSYFILLVFIFLSLTVPNPIKDFFLPNKTVNSQLITENLLVTPSEDIRKIVWTGAIDLWKRYPLFGTGPETFAYSYYWTRPASHNLTSEWQFLYNKAHNEYLNYLATTGLVGLISYFTFITVSTVVIIRSKSNLKLPIIASYLSILITNISGFSTITTSIYFFILPLLALYIPDIVSPAKTIHNKPKVVYLIILVSCFLLLTSKTVTYYLADLAYAKSVRADKQGQFYDSYNLINVSLLFRTKEPQYQIQRSTAAAKIAAGTKDKNYTSIAIKSGKSAITTSPYDTNLLKQLAQNYFYLSTIDKVYLLDSQNILHKLTQLSPTDPSNHYILGQFYQQTNDLDSAIAHYLQAITLKPNYDHATFALGELYFQQKKYSEAKNLFDTTLQIVPTNTDAKNYLSSIATMSGE